MRVSPLEQPRESIRSFSASSKKGSSRDIHRPCLKTTNPCQGIKNVAFRLAHDFREKDYTCSTRACIYTRSGARQNYALSFRLQLGGGLAGRL